jgi:TonB family protein
MQSGNFRYPDRMSLSEDRGDSPGGAVSLRGKTGLSLCLLLVGLACVGGSVNARGQEQEAIRKTKSKVEPMYPDLARRMKISGLVKVDVIVAANGTVKDAKVVGGHPVLANAVLDAVKKWRFEPGPQETTETLQFRFDPDE